MEAAGVEFIDENGGGQRWSRFPGQCGGNAKMDSGFDYAASRSMNTLSIQQPRPSIEKAMHNGLGRLV